MRQAIDPGEGEAPRGEPRRPGGLASGGGARRGLAGVGLGREGGAGRRHNLASAPPSHTKPPVPRLFGCAPAAGPPSGALTASANENVVQ